MKKLLTILLFVPVMIMLLGSCDGRDTSLSGKQLSFVTTDIDGNPVRSDELFARHDITMVNLWGTWCGPCIQELPELNKVNAALAEMGGAVVGLINDGKGPNDVELAKRYISENDVEYLNILSPENMNEIIRQSYYPTTVFVDRDGVIIGKTLLGTPAKSFIFDYYVEAARDALDQE